jgi:hypothetical protein
MYLNPMGVPPPVLPPPAFFSIDVECVATGTDHNSRDVGQISLVVSPFIAVLYTLSYHSYYYCFILLSSPLF